MLEAMTDATLLAHAIDLTVTGPAECVKEARALFGADALPDQPHKVWTLPPDMLDLAIKFAMSGHRWPRQSADHIRLSFAYRFNWLHFTDPLPEPLASWRHGTSSLGLIFQGGRLYASADFTVPVPYDSQAFRDFYVPLQAMLPFELKHHYFRRLLVNPKTHGVSVRRLL